MPKTVQIRDIDDEVYAALVRRAADEGITVPELLRREAVRLAAARTGLGAEEFGAGMGCVLHRVGGGFRCDALDNGCAPGPRAWSRLRHRSRRRPPVSFQT